ncbi:unnamed protein product [Caenorhabditis angaria]|uniref:Uncharacterized protein n=1 Tax=Caenorhabditis angaria TaxID=860376 RepID=A0A9P1IMH2_9PELO|nr:unnamed protein product [Caenorhabditis angaria]
MLMILLSLFFSIFLVFCGGKKKGNKGAAAGGTIDPNPNSESKNGEVGGKGAGQAGKNVKSVQNEVTVDDGNYEELAVTGK